MLLATALLHAAGVGVGLGLGRLANGWALRLSGAAVAAGFVLLVAGVL
jgi:hydrogenase/urease accessory protein HupE